jgi:capsular polysaccharide biosynthesis protein
MELKEYLQIIRRKAKLFSATAAIILVASFGYLFFRPVTYVTSLTLNITRSGVSDTQDYRYDDFYRLQADEKFSETVVQWLKSPRVEEDIYREAGIDTKDYSLKQLAKSISADKLSSQLVAVSFSATDEKIAQKIATAISKIISQNTQSLNKDQNESTWFEVLASAPVVRPNELSPLVVLAIFLGAIFAAFWGVMIKHYLE